MSVFRVAEDVVRIDAPLPLRSPRQINCYLVRDALPEGDLLVDTGMTESRDVVAEALRATGARLGGVLITHGHIDHWGAATSFAPSVLAHEGSRVELDFAAGTLDAGGPEMPFDAETAAVLAAYRDLVEAVPAIESVDDEARLGEWRVLWTPGHAPGHICLFRERDGVLISGDQLLPGFTPNIQPGLDGGDALANFLGSLDRLDELPVRLVLPAHGEPFVGARGRTEELRSHHRRRLTQLDDRLRAAPAALAELTGLLFGRLVEPDDRFLATLETYAHLVHLQQAGRAERRGDRWESSAGS